MTFVRGILASVLLLPACSTAPATDTACEFTNAAWCDDGGRLIKVCSPIYASLSAPPVLRWRDAPVPYIPDATCGCALDPEQGALSALCTNVQADTGSLCVTPTADLWQGGTLSENQPLNVHVRRPGCLPGSCSRNVVASCAIQRDGSTLRVTSYFSAGVVVTGWCTAICLFSTAHCVSEPLPAGQYTLVLGERTMPLTIPSTVPERTCDSL